MEDVKNQFYKLIQAKPQMSNSFLMDKVKYNKLLREVKEAKLYKKGSHSYWLLRHYDVISKDGKELLVTPPNGDRMLHYICKDELFEVLQETHVLIGHGGRDRMRKVLAQKYKNITMSHIQTFVNLCQICCDKRKGGRRPLDMPLKAYPDTRQTLIPAESIKHAPEELFVIEDDDDNDSNLTNHPISPSTVESVESSHVTDEEIICTPSKRKLTNDLQMINCVSDSRDEFGAISVAIACKLKRMNANQRDIAEFLINQVLYYGLQNKLDEDVYVAFNSKQLNATSTTHGNSSS